MCSSTRDAWVCLFVTLKSFFGIYVFSLGGVNVRGFDARACDLGVYFQSDGLCISGGM